MKLLTTALILAFTGRIASAISKKVPGYAGCVTSKFGNGCTQCYRRKVKADGTCGPLLPESDPCQLYDYNANNNSSECVACKPGYAAFTDVNNQNAPDCVKGTIPDCINEYVVKTGASSDTSCQACSGHDVYSITSLRFINYDCKKVSDPLPNCLVGGLAIPNDGKSCYRCQPGYAVNLITGHCEPAALEGCWIQDGRCLSCDPFAGWSMDPQLSCIKVGGQDLSVERRN